MVSTFNSTMTDGRLVVGVADMAMSSDVDKDIITHALGSCIGVTIYDPQAKIGGMLHFMLPSAKVSPGKADTDPLMFGDLGIPILFKSCYEKGAKKENLIVCAAGGAEILDGDGNFKIGSRNRTMLRKLFWKNNILLSADDTGGTISRTLMLRMSDGQISVRTKGKEKILWSQ